MASSIPSSSSNYLSELFLLDADYVSFFWGAIGKEEVKKLFNVVDKALGKSANKLTDTDFKKISIDEPEEDANKEESPSEDIVEEPIEDTSTSNENNSDK